AADGPPDHQHRAAGGSGSCVPPTGEWRRSDEDPGELRVNVLSLFKLDGKTALVTGCKRGIGKAMALALAEAGADIAGVSKTLEPEGSAIEREVIALGRKFKGYTCDFGDRAAVKAFLLRAP